MVCCVYCGTNYADRVMYILNGNSCCHYCANKKSIKIKGNNDTTIIELQNALVTLLTQVKTLKEKVDKLENKEHKKHHKSHHGTSAGSGEKKEKLNVSQ